MVSLVDGCAPAADAHVKSGGTARRRRHQTRRADARHVDWLLSLQQARGAHHTAPMGGRGLAGGTLEARIDALEGALALLMSGHARAVAPAEAQEDVIGFGAHDAVPGEVHLIALQAAAAVSGDRNQNFRDSGDRNQNFAAVAGEMHPVPLQASAAAS